MSDPKPCLIVEAHTFEVVRKQLGHFQDMPLTLVLPPNLAGPVTREFRRTFPNWDIGMLGWEGTLNECLCWTAEQAVIKIDRAVGDMGYDMIFRPPNGVYDRELLGALETLKRSGVNICTINNPGTNPSGPTLEFYPGNPDYQRECQIVNAAKELSSTAYANYGYAFDHSVNGDPYDDHE